MATQYKRVGDLVYSKVEKVNSELFSLTYGALVMQLLKDYEDIAEVNRQLEQMGYNIGERLIDEFLARSGIGKVAQFKDTAEIVAKIGFKMFLGVTATVVPGDDREYSLVLEENPLVEFVELPESHRDLYYSNILCGVIRGALEMVQMRVECRFLRDVLRGDDLTEIRVIFKEFLDEGVPVSDD